MPPLKTIAQTATCLLISLQQVHADYAANAEAAFNQLQQWYNTDAGTWMPSTGWWNSANCLTVIANLAAVDQAVSDNASSLWQDVLTKAPASQPMLMKRHIENSLPATTYYKTPRNLDRRGSGSFLNGFYDDEGWWALAWIAVYDHTGDSQYLDTATNIFEDMHASEGTTPCKGGIWWDKAHTYVNAIANELYLSVAAHLANRHPENKQYYLNIANGQWKWFNDTGLINSDNTINDGLDSSCKNNGKTVWSYNQGVILGALTELNRASGDSSLIETAKLIADAAISTLAPNGILHDPCEPNCGGDGSQFKGVFARNMMLLQQAASEDRYATFLHANADSIWNSDRDGNQLSVDWAGPYIAPANASTESSALDAIVGALSI